MLHSAMKSMQGVLATEPRAECWYELPQCQSDGGLGEPGVGGRLDDRHQYINAVPYPIVYGLLHVLGSVMILCHFVDGLHPALHG